MASDNPVVASDITPLPLLPLRDVCLSPHGDPLFVGRPKSIKALDAAMEAGKHILLVARSRRRRTTRCRRPVRNRQRGDDPADAEASRRHGEGAGRGHAARARRHRHRMGEYLSADVQLVAGDPGKPTRSRRCAGRSSRSRPVREAQQEDPPEILTSMSGIDDGGASPTRSPRTCRSSSSRSTDARDGRTSPSASSTCSACSEARSTSCRSKSASAAASRADGEEPARVYLNEQSRRSRRSWARATRTPYLDEMEKKIKDAACRRRRRPRRSRS